MNRLRPTLLLLPGFAALALAALASSAALFGKNPPCEARLTVINASGQDIRGGSLQAPGAGDKASLTPLPAGGSRVFVFPEYREGFYRAEIVHADGSVTRDSAGYLIPTAAWRDTLTVLPPGTKRRLHSRQSSIPCREGFRWKSFLRRLLRQFF